MTNAVSLAQQASTGVSPGFRNRIINGAMVIDQRNAGASVTIDNTIAYTVDRWNVEDSTDGVLSVQQVVDAPNGFYNSLKVTVTTADSSLGATQWAKLLQPVEANNVTDLDFGLSTAKTITVSFWVKSSLTGTFGASVLNSAENRCFPFSYTINSANTWEYKTATIPGDTTGSWTRGSNLIGLRLVFGLGVGSTYSGTAGAWTSSSFIYSVTGSVNLINTLNATWQITGVQLEVGSTATSFDYRPYGTELALCQRYYQIVALNIYNGNPGASEYHSVPVAYLAQMRATPTGGTITGGSSLNLLFTGVESITAYGCRFTIQSNANSDAGYTGGQIPLNAEL